MIRVPDVEVPLYKNKYKSVCSTIPFLSYKRDDIEIKTIDKLNLNFTIKVPIKFMLLLNYKDTFCNLFGFQNIGLDTSITEEHYEITNKTKYFNQETLLTKHININPYNYIYCLCDQIHSNNIRTNVKFDLEDVNASVFSIFQIYKQKKNSNNIFNSFTK